MTFGEMLTSVTNWSREVSEPDIAADALNDAIERLGDKLFLVRLSDLFGGPITAQFAQDANTFNIVMVMDPQVAPTVSSVADQAAPPGPRTVSVCYTYVTETGSETLPSPATQFNVPAANFITVASPAPSSNPNKTYGWVPYVQDPTTQQWYLLTELPCLIGQPAQEDTSPPAYKPLPVVNQTNDSLFYIKHMEMQDPNGNVRSWNQEDIDGDTMRRLASNTSGGSPYSRYAFDLVNYSQLEIRPTPGAGISPQLYYVSRPGRIAFENVLLPFGNINSAQAFMRYEALALLFMAVDEDDRASAWQTKADSTLQSIVTAQTRTRARVGLNVKPYAGMM